MTQKLGNLFIDGENSYNDKSGNNHTVTVHGNPVINTAEKKFGNSSIYFNGSTDYLSTPLSEDLDFGSDDFTIDFWVNLSSLSNNQAVIANTASNGIGAYIFYVNSNQLQLYVGSTGTNFDILAGSKYWNPSINTWCHVALVRSGSTFIMFHDGIMIDSFTSSATLASINNTIYIANRPYNTTFNSYTECKLDNIRFVKGEALWTSNFTLNDIELAYKQQVYNHLMSVYNIGNKKINLRGKAKAGFIRPTIKEFFTSKNYEEILK